MASSNNSLELSINPGLNLNMRVQNSISFKAPSPSKSPSLSIHISSSSLMPCNPNKAEFLFKLWNVITPFSSSINNRNPLPSSFIKPSAPNFSTMAGKKSSNTTPFLDPIDDQASIHVKKSKTLLCTIRFWLLEAWFVWKGYRMGVQYIYMGGSMKEFKKKI